MDHLAANKMHINHYWDLVAKQQDADKIAADRTAKHLRLLFTYV